MMSSYKVEICGVNTSRLPVLKEDEKNARLAKKAAKKIEKVEMRSKKEHSGKKIFLLILLFVLCFVSGFAAAFLVAWVNKVSFAVPAFLPFVVLVDVFAFSTVSFFSNEGKKEVAAGAVSLLSLAGGIAELAFLFH